MDKEIKNTLHIGPNVMNYKVNRDLSDSVFVSHTTREMTTFLETTNYLGIIPKVHFYDDIECELLEIKFPNT